MVIITFILSLINLAITLWVVDRLLNWRSYEAERNRGAYDLWVANKIKEFKKDQK